MSKNKTNTYTLFFICLLFIIFSAFNAMGREELHRVSVLMRDGSVIATEDLQYVPLVESHTFSALNQYVKLESLTIESMFFFQDKTKRVLDWQEIYNNIRSIKLLSPGLTPYRNGGMIITPKTGKPIKTNNATFLQYIGNDTAVSHFNVLKYDSYNNWWKAAYIDIRDVEKIVFDSDQLVKDAINGKIIRSEEEKLGFETTADGIKKALTRKESGGRVNLSIEFDFNSAKIRKTSYYLLNELLQALQDLKSEGKILMINGHADSDGSDAYNMTLSLRRARSVKSYLTKNGRLAPLQLQVKGFGETQPLVPNINKKNKQINRRVEIRLD